jgi:hypothetical protein
MRGPREGDKEACGRGCTAKEHVATADRMVTSAFHGGRFGARLHGDLPRRKLQQMHQ